MLSFINFAPFNYKKQNSKYQELKNDDKISLMEEMDSTVRQPMELNNQNFDIIRLPNRVGGETRVKRISWRHFRQSTTQLPRSWKLRISRQPKRKNYEVPINHLKLILRNQPQPVLLNGEGDAVVSKLPAKLASKKATTKILTHLNKPPDANIIISVLKKEPHPSYDLTKIHKVDCPPRGVCLRQSQADYDSQTVLGEDMIDVTKALAMRIVPSSEVINLITGLSLGKLVGIVSESTGLFDALALGSKHLIDRTDAHQHLVGVVPKDRVSVWSYWWGYEIALPPPSVERLKQARSIETTALQILAALTATSGAIEIFPLIKYLSAYLDIEWNAISAENKGQGVVIAATWALPMALVPRAWDFDAPAIAERQQS